MMGVRLGEVIRSLNLKVGKNEEGAVLTGDSPNQNYIHPIVCAVDTLLRFPEDD